MKQIKYFLSILLCIMLSLICVQTKGTTPAIEDSRTSNEDYVLLSLMGVQTKSIMPVIEKSSDSNKDYVPFRIPYAEIKGTKPVLENGASSEDSVRTIDDKMIIHPRYNCDPQMLVPGDPDIDPGVFLEDVP